MRIGRYISGWSAIAVGCCLKVSGDCLTAVIEYAIKRRPHKHPSHNPAKRPKWQFIVHAIRHLRASGNFLELVAMPPQTIRPGQLQVDKVLAIDKLFNQRLPLHPDSVKSQLVIDARSRTHRNRIWSKDVKTQKRRRNPFQVMRIREKCEHLRLRLRQDSNPLKAIDHRPLPVLRALFPATSSPIRIDNLIWTTEQIMRWYRILQSLPGRQNPVRKPFILQKWRRISRTLFTAGIRIWQATLS